MLCKVQGVNPLSNSPSRLPGGEHYCLNLSASMGAQNAVQWCFTANQWYDARTPMATAFLKEKSLRKKAHCG